MGQLTKNEYDFTFVDIHCGPIKLEGNLSVPNNSVGIVLFVHGSGSSRKSPRNRFVADVLNQKGIALKKMAEVAENGASAIDRAQMQSLLNKTAAQNMSQQKQILENRAARGMSGSGDELAAQLAAQQASQNAASNEAMQMAALLAQRKMDATKDLSNMSSAAQNNEFNRKSQIASAQDAINRFNASQQASTQSRNVSAANEAMARNLTNRQNIANQNVDLSNKQQTYNTGLTQTDFDNKLRLGQAQTGAYSKMAANKQSGADATAGMWSNIGKGALDIFNAYKGASGDSSSGTMTTQDVNPDDLGDQGGYKKGNLWAR